jgi:hypothetical protein
LKGTGNGIRHGGVAPQTGRQTTCRDGSYGGHFECDFAPPVVARFCPCVSLLGERIERTLLLDTSGHNKSRSGDRLLLETRRFP